MLSRPALLGDGQEMVVQMKSLSNEKRNVILIHQKMLFDDKECQILTIRDTSANFKLKKATEKNNLMNLLTSSVSHDLITPTKCINTFAEDLIDADLGEEATHKIVLIRSAGRMLLAQIKMLLDRSLMEKGEFHPQLALGYVGKIVEETSQILQGQASLKNVKIETTPDYAGMPLLIDEMRIQQVLLNLLTNAIKFSPKDSIIKVNLFTW